MLSDSGNFPPHAGQRASSVFPPSTFQSRIAVSVVRFNHSSSGVLVFAIPGAIWIVGRETERGQDAL